MRRITALLFCYLTISCCEIVPTPPQYVFIRNYPTQGLVITSAYGIDLRVKGYGTDFFVSVEKGDSLCFINPINSLNNDLKKTSDKVFLFNKLLNRTDTILVKYSIKKIDNCNEYLKIDEAYLNEKKGLISKTEKFEEIIELK